MNILGAVEARAEFDRLSAEVGDAGACPACGDPMGARLTLRGSVADARHEVGGRVCRALAFARDAEARGLVRVTGEEAVELRLAGIEVVGGPLDPRPRFDPTVVVLSVGDPSKPRPTSASYAPRWARYFRFAFPAQFQAGRVYPAQLSTFYGSRELQEALCACGDLAQTGGVSPTKLRRALRSFIEGAVK